jgi:hypothetical protein
MVVNTRDGVCWERRAVTDSGLGLYAVEGSCKCPPFKMATLAELAERGIVGSADVLPMPVPVVPEPLSAERLTEIAARADAATAGPWWTDTLAEHDGSESVGIDAEGDIWIVPCQDIDQADAEFMAHARVDVPALLAEVRRQAARIAELEAQREALAERLRAGQQWRQGRNPELVSENFVSQSELRSIFGIPLVAPWADGLTRTFAPVASLREPEPEFYGSVHHDWRLGRDLPELGGAR